MKTMPNIELTDKELEILIEESKFDYGGEAMVLRNNNPHTLYKIFTVPGTDIEAEMDDNKFRKIIRLYNQPLEGMISPLSTISNRGKLIGYEMTYDEEDECLLNVIMSDRERTHFLHEAKDILLYFASQDVTYGDVKDDKVLLNRRTGKAKFCDIDNIRLQELPIDIMGHGLAEYFDEVRKIDEKADAYMHNLLTLEQLKYNNLSHKAILNRLSANPYLVEFPDEAQKIFSTLCEPQKFNGEYAIQYIKRK